MNPLILLPLALIIVPFIPTIIELFERKDAGPREVPEQTTYEEPPDVKDIPRIERANMEARMKVPGDIIRITGNVVIPNETVINNHLIVQGDLKVGKRTHIYGSVKAFGNVELGESTVVEGHVLSEGRIRIGKDCRVKGIVDSLKDIILEENAVVEAVSTEKTVRIGPNAKINRRILSGSSIITLPPEMKEEEKITTPKKVEKEPSKPKVEERSPEIPAKHIPKPSRIEEKTPREIEIPFEVLDPEIGHMYLYAPTRYGKTYLIKNYIIPQLADKKKIVVIDSHREYPFKQFIVNYDKTIPKVDNDLFKTFITFNIWGDIESIINKMIDHIMQSNEHVAIRPNMTDSNVEALIISEFLKKMTQVRWKTPILLIVEDADRYDVFSVVTRGRHSNIQVILTSARKLMPEILSNAYLVIGNINPSLIGDYDMRAAKAVVALKKHEFLWEKDYHDWRRFRLEEVSSEIVEEREAARTALQPRSLEAKPSLPVRIVSSPQVVVAKSSGISDEIFKRLEERIRMLEESKKPPTKPLKSHSLTSIESKVLKATYKCRSQEEICLRLMLDPSEAEKVIDSLVKKGYLDRNLKPKIPPESIEGKKPLESETAEKILSAPDIRASIATEESGESILKEWRKTSSQLLKKVIGKDKSLGG